MSKDKIVEIDPQKRINKKIINDIIDQLVEIRDSDPTKLDSFFLTIGVNKDETLPKYKGGVIYRASHWGVDFGSLGFVQSVIDEISAMTLYNEVSQTEAEESFPDLTPEDPSPKKPRK